MFAFEIPSGIAVVNGPVGLSADAIDPFSGWIVYLSVLALSCVVLWSLDGPPPAIRHPAPKSGPLDLDEAA